MLMRMGSQLVCTSRWSTCTAQRVPGIWYRIRMDSRKLGTMLCACHVPSTRRDWVIVPAQVVKPTSCQSLETRLCSS